MSVIRVAGVTALAVLLASVTSFPSPAGATIWEAGPGAQGEATVDGVIDSPAANATVTAGQEFPVQGWVVDRSAEGWAGIDEAHLYSGRAGEGGVFLGKGLVALPRPDVSAALGNPAHAASGFSFVVSGTQLAAGRHTLTVYAHTPHKGWWTQAITISVAAPTATPTPSAATSAGLAAATTATKSTAVIRVLEPVDGSRAVGSDKLVKGWAADARAASGTGVDKVEVWLDGARNGSGASFLGLAKYGENYGTPAEELGDSRFVLSGWDVTWHPTKFSNGYHVIYVYAHSAYDDQWYLVRLSVRVACAGEDKDEKQCEARDDEEEEA